MLDLKTRPCLTVLMLLCLIGTAAADSSPLEPSDTSAQRMAGLPGITLFPSIQSNQGCELWSTDGTPSGTQLVLDINPGPASSEPRHLHGIQWLT